jgi:hypothetical protein
MLVLRICLAALCIVLASCSEKDSGVGPADNVIITVTHEDVSERVDVTTLPSDTVDGVAIVRLSSFISSTLVPPYVDKDGNGHDSRSLYAYRLTGADGFNPRKNRGYDDNIWDHLELGYYLLEGDQVLFPDENIDLPGAFNVKSPRTIDLFRKIDIIHPLGDTTVFRELDDLTTVVAMNLDGQPEEAVSLAAVILSDTLLANPEQYVYRLRAVDEYESPAITWDQLATGHWLISSGRTIFTAPELGQGKYRLQALEAIVVQEL